MPNRLTNFTVKVSFVYMHRLSRVCDGYARSVSAYSLRLYQRFTAIFTHIYSVYIAESYVSFLLHWYFPMRFN